MKQAESLVAAVLIACMTSCAGPATNRLFEYTADTYVGRPVSDVIRASQLDETVRISKDYTEYRFQGPPEGCRWAYVVNNDGVIVSWHYISPSVPCRMAPSWQTR